MDPEPFLFKRSADILPFFSTVTLYIEYFCRNDESIILVDKHNLQNGDVPTALNELSQD